MKTVIVPIICACGWTGKVATRGLCGGCASGHTQRLTKQRLVKLQEIAAWREVDRPIALAPMMAMWFTRRRLLDRVAGTFIGVQTIARGSRRCNYVVTQAGMNVIQAADLADRQAGSSPYGSMPCEAPLRPDLRSRNTVFVARCTDGDLPTPTPRT
jgi:hypothetical protein